MSKKEKFVEPKRVVQFSDILALQEDLKKFEQRRINGRLISRIDQYLVSLGSVRIDEWGDIIVRDSVAYGWFVDVDEQLKSYEYRQMEKAGTLPKRDMSPILGLRKQVVQKMTAPKDQLADVVPFET